MTVPKWLIPVLAGIAAVGVAVAATLIGARFAPGETTVAQSETEIVPVLAPIGAGEAPPAETTDSADDEDPGAETPLVVSDAVAEREVVVAVDGAGVPASDPSLVHLLDGLATWPDGLLGLLNLAAEDRDDRDDPCADPSADGDCPDGLRSTILSTTALRDFTAGGQAYPPTYAEYLDHGNRFGGILWCDGLDPADDEVPFGILATAPGVFEVRYWPTADPGAEREVTISSTGDQVAAWEEQVELPDGLPLVQQCFTLDGIEPDTAYTAVVTGVDMFDRVAPGHTVRFSSSGAPTHPGIQVNPVGDNLLFVSGLHTRAETLDIRAYLVASDARPACDAPSDATRLVPLTDTTVDAHPDEINALTAPPDFTRKQVRTFVVPEGGTVILCGRWFPGGDAPSWESSQPTFESSAIAQAADRLVPRVSLFDVSRFDEEIDRIEVSVASAEGVPCWDFAWTPDRDDSLPIELCRPSDFAGGGTGSDGERLWTRGFGGDLVLTITARLASGESSETSHVLPAADRGCRGVCEPLERLWFRVALEPVAQAVGLCGSVLGSDCSAPTRDVAAGSATFFVDWEQGLSNGLAEWNITPTLDTPVDYVAPDLAQIDWDDYWSFTTPTLAVPWSTASLTLAVDRPVDYELRFLAGSGPAERCDGGGSMVTSGSSVASGADHTIRLAMPGLCLGGQYAAELELVDADGRRAIWSLERTHTFWGGMALVGAPAIRAELFYEIRAQTYSRQYLRVLDLEFNGGSLRPVETRSGRCLVDGLISSGGSEEVSLRNINRISLALLVTDSARWGDAEAWGAECLGVATDETARVASVEVDLAQLFTPEGVVIEAPDLYSARVVLRALVIG